VDWIKFLTPVLVWFVAIWYLTGCYCSSLPINRKRMGGWPAIGLNKKVRIKKCYDPKWTVFGVLDKGAASAAS